ncbi:TerB family tellurite resistance protein, partial [Alphaproteobacteria bacterium]|nr:TerB family tellurite resistance protein [Alphaproteobacteria bacterium]
NNLYQIGKNMFSNLKLAIQKVTSKTTEEDEYKGEDVQAVIILLLEACQIDGETGQVELDYIKKLLVNKFGFNEKDANDNISKALEDSEQRIEIFSQIKVILNEMNHEERIEVIQMMWGVILADGVIDDFEANLMRRMNGLLYVSGVESAAAKENAMTQLK